MRHRAGRKQELQRHPSAQQTRLESVLYWTKDHGLKSRRRSQRGLGLGFSEDSENASQCRGALRTSVLRSLGNVEKTDESSVIDMLQACVVFAPMQSPQTCLCVCLRGG